MKKQKGITLIALIITIIVILILTSVTISLTLGERGIFNTAKKAGENYKEANEKELADLLNFEQEAQNVINGIESGEIITNPVTNIELTTTSQAIKSSDNFILTANISPSNATYKEIIWSTSNPDVASISSTSGGSITVKGINEGSAVITAKAADGKGATKECIVTVSAKQLNTISAINYGDYVNYPISIGRGPEEIAQTHKTDWRIFYNDGTYVYLIASYLLLNSQMPTTTSMKPYDERPYTSYWTSAPTENASFSTIAKNQYKMTLEGDVTHANLKCVSELLNTSNWVKFVNTTFAEDAVGAPTIEMWVDSWNSKEIGTKLYYNNSNENGYYIGTLNIPTTTYTKVDNSDNLYFPVRNDSVSTGINYWLASPHSSYAHYLMCVYSSGDMNSSSYTGGYLSTRPVVRLRSSIVGTLKDGIWTLK